MLKKLFTSSLVLYNDKVRSMCVYVGTFEALQRNALQPKFDAHLFCSPRYIMHYSKETEIYPINWTCS